MHHFKWNKTLSYLILALGIFGGGYSLGWYYYHAKIDANTVTVKGLAELDVKADLAVWEIKYVVTGNNLQAAQQQLENQAGIIKQFLLDHRIKAEEISMGRLETNDLMANPYRSNNENAVRFILNRTIVVKSADVELVAKTFNQAGELVSKGIVFSQDYGYPVSYLFTRLNEIKPQMLAAATENARQAAWEFANNSGSTVGAIHHANQGVFSILPGEQTPSAVETQQIHKKIRVVSTVEYWLK